MKMNGTLGEKGNNSIKTTNMTNQSYSYGKEEGCDTIFFAGHNEDIKLRLPAHSNVLKANEVFEALFRNEQRDSDGCYKIEVPDVDGRAMDNLLRYLYGEPIKINCIDTTLYTLYAGHKYQCDGLVKFCTSNLTAKLRKENAVKIMKFIKIFSGDIQNLQNVAKESEMKKNGFNETLPQKESIGKPVPSAPLLNELENNIECSCAELFNSCLSCIEQNAYKILDYDGIEDLDLETLALILSSDFLNVKHEFQVFAALERWATQQCKFNGLALTNGNKHEVLKGSLFLPRYLTMTIDGFKNGPGVSGLLNDQEVEIICGLISGKYKLTQVAGSITIPRAYFDKSGKPRTPRILPSSPIRKPKETKLRSWKRWPSILRRLFQFSNSKCCCPSQAESLPNSPVHGKLSSPIRNPGCRKHSNSSVSSTLRNRKESQYKVNCVEQAIVCFACVFD